MVQPVGTSGERQFETLNIFQPGQTNQCAAPKVTGKANMAKALFVRTAKSTTADFTPTLPEDNLQATDQALFDQSGNVVLYNVLYNSTECKATTTTGYLPNTIEIKSSWRILAAPDPNFYTMTAVVKGVSTTPVILGLVGFHLVINTQNHPEFVWATFEHVNNAPNCTNPQNAPASGWSFLSQKCTECLQKNGINGCPDCKFNTGPKGPPSGLKGTPTEVCRVFPDGTDPGAKTPPSTNDNDQNRFNIDTLNKQIGDILGKLPADSPMAVWKNYTLVAGLWTNGGVASTGSDVQRGSLEAANTTMETFFQQSNHNCFTCHTYDPTKSKVCVSHIVNSLIPDTGCGKKKPSAD